MAALLVVNRAARSSRALVVLGVAVLATGVPLAAVAVANGPPMALVLVGILGLGSVVTDVLALTALQRLIPSDHLARVFGILDSLLVGANVLGAAISAWLVGLVGIRATLIAIGVAPAITVVGVAGLARRRVEAGAVDLTLLRPAVDLLAGLPMLRTASVASIEALAVAATERSVPAGTEAIRQGTHRTTSTPSSAVGSTSSSRAATVPSTEGVRWARATGSVRSACCTASLARDGRRHDRVAGPPGAGPRVPPSGRRRQGDGRDRSHGGGRRLLHRGVTAAWLPLASCVRPSASKTRSVSCPGNTSSSVPSTTATFW